MNSKTTFLTPFKYIFWVFLMVLGMNNSKAQTSFKVFTNNPTTPTLDVGKDKTVTVNGSFRNTGAICPGSVISTTASSYTISDTDAIIFLTGSVAQTIILPPASTYPSRQISIFNPTTYEHSISGAYTSHFGDTYETYLHPKSSLVLVSDGSNWREISSNNDCTTIHSGGATYHLAGYSVSRDSGNISISPGVYGYTRLLGTVGVANVNESSSPVYYGQMNTHSSPTTSVKVSYGNAAYAMDCKSVFYSTTSSSSSIIIEVFSGVIFNNVGSYFSSLRRVQ